MIFLKAYAKINLSLDIIGKRPDGYHDLCMVMQSVHMADDISISESPCGITLKSDLSFLPCDSKNIAYRAAQLFLEATGINSGVIINIRKRIHVGGGLGGGSTDAAAVLMGMNKLFGYPLSFSELSDIGLSCGADVPFCLTGGTCLAEGLGEKLTVLPPIPRCYILLIRPQFSISTKKVFECVDMQKIEKHPDTEGIVNAIKCRDANSLYKRLYNTLELFVDRPEISAYKSILSEAGAEASLMTGSGAVVYGIFKTCSAANRARSILREKGIRSTVTTPISVIY